MKTLNNTRWVKKTSITQISAIFFEISWKRWEIQLRLLLTLDDLDQP